MASELIALDSSNQTAFTKAVKNIKKSIKAKKERVAEKKYSRGIILVEHLPHGFFEEGLRGFFSQFGKVMRLRLARSNKTGRSKGYAFVEFEFEEVAKIAAESMHNYLMYERLIKCQLLPTGTKGKTIFAGLDFGKNNYPKLTRRNELKRIQSEPLTLEDATKYRNIRLEKVKEHNNKLAKLGINYEFKIRDKTSAELEEGSEDEEKLEVTVTPKQKLQVSKVETPKSEKKQQTPDKNIGKSGGKVTPKHKIEESIEIKSDKKKTPELKKTKFSPRVLRSRVRGSLAANEIITAIQAQADKQQKKKVTASEETKKVVKEKPKFSPKILRSRVRQSEGFTPSAPSKSNRRKSIK